MAKTAKTPQNKPIGRFQQIRTKIKAVFNLIRIARVVLKHTEACLSELFALDSEELENQLPGVVDFTDPSRGLTDPEMD
jgi:hypothetical protein